MVAGIDLREGEILVAFKEGSHGYAAAVVAKLYAAAVIVGVLVPIVVVVLQIEVVVVIVVVAVAIAVW